MIQFVKLQGAGNDFVLLDMFQRDAAGINWGPISKKLCDRRFGIGGDGLLVLTGKDDQCLEMAMFNPDGSLSEMCGNGLRCLAFFCWEKGYAAINDLQIKTGAGLLKVTRDAATNQISTEMGIPSFDPILIGLLADSAKEVPLPFGYTGTAVSMGNPHVVVVVPKLDEIPLEAHGSVIERLKLFQNGANVHFAQIIGPNQVKVKHWERGAGATLACGTGACAVATVILELGLATGPNVEVIVPGGILTALKTDTGQIALRGPARSVYSGVWHPS